MDSSKNPDNPGIIAFRAAPSASAAEKEILVQIRQQPRRFLTMIVVAALMDIAVFSFLTLSAVIAAKYFPNVPEKVARIWKVLGVLSIALSLATKVALIRCGLPILPPRSAASFSSIIRRQARNSDRIILWFDLRLIIRSLCLSLIAFILTQRSTPRRALDWTAVVFLLISAGVFALNLSKYRAQKPKADDSLLGAVRLLIYQTRYRIRSIGNLLYYVIPFLVGFLLLFQNVRNAKGVVPVLASAAPPYPLAIGLGAFAISLLALVIVARTQFRFFHRMHSRLRERLEQLEQLLAELSQEPKSNRGETLSS